MAPRAFAKDQTRIPVEPCPFCEREVIISNSHFWNGANVRSAVLCDSCGSVGPVGDGPRDAVEKWNTVSRNARTADVYNKLAGVSSPLEFAAWIKEVKDLAAIVAKINHDDEMEKKIKETSDRFQEMAKILEIYALDREKGGFSVSPEIASIFAQPKNAKRKNP